ncbi:MAG: ribonuclease Z [Anaerotruncus sp.]|nr:ribonuclease Z [Anaerotruncus sp.]
MLDVCLAGTGGMMPLENRWLTCCWTEYQGDAILIDCGEGTQIALKKAGCKLSRLRLLLFTHFHADHTAGLPGLLLTVGNSGKTSPLTIVGPRGLRRVVEALMTIAPALTYPLELVELDASQPGSLDAAPLEISWLPLRHRVPCVGYRITLRRPPVFNPQKAQALAIPVQFYRRLHAGQAVELEDGRTIQPEQVLDGERAPIRVCYCTDTLPIPEIATFAQNADLMIGEGMYGDDEMREKLQEKTHSLFSDTARLAKQAGAQQLWLTHYSPALTDPQGCLDVARAIFPATTAAYDGIRTTLTGE